MLKRVYINNYRCLVNFELSPGPRQLIIGPNGSGKSSLVDALLFLRRILVFGQDLEQQRILGERTLWMTEPNLTFEIEALLENTSYVYRLVVDSDKDPPKARISSETVTLNGKSIFDFKAGNVHLVNELFERPLTYPFDCYRSALATITEPKVNRNLAKFKRWFRNLLCIRINPFTVDTRADTEESYPWRDLSNFSAWYRYLRLSNRTDDDALHKSLQTTLDGFKSLQFEDFGGGTRLLQAEFKSEGGGAIKLNLNQLSDGQRCLIGLYTILHFVIAKGHTVILDEPDNFIALREIQPWLNEVSASIDEGSGQALIISHHPELMNQWAPDYGIRFFRDDTGPVRIKQFNGQAYSTLTPSEVVARGWENE